jgi:uncharacterized protein (DUF302 family)
MRSQPRGNSYQASNGVYLGKEESQMKMKIGSALVGIVVGMVLMGLIIWRVMPSMMLIQHKSSRNFDESVAAIGDAVNKKQDWKILGVNDYQKRIREGGYGDINRIGSIALCNPRYSSRILAEDSNKKVTAFMPIEIGIYEDKSGQVYVSELNVGLLGKMFGGTIAEVMGDAGKDIKDIIGALAQK